MEREDEFAGELMRRHGIPARRPSRAAVGLAELPGVGRERGDHAPAAPTARRWSCAAARLRVLHRPGHSPSDTLLHDEERGLLLAGDHLIEHISSNPLISLPLPDGPTARSTTSPSRRRSGRATLLMYMESMRATRAMEVDVVLSGHGKPITGPRRRSSTRASRCTRGAQSASAASSPPGRRRPTRSARSCGATSPSRRPTSRCPRSWAMSTCCSPTAPCARRRTAA